MTHKTAAAATHGADNEGFNYYGRWHAAKSAVTLCSGAILEFAYCGNHCVLLFDVSGFSQYPAVFVQADNGPILKTTLAADTYAVPVIPPHNVPPAGKPPFKEVFSNCHMVRVWVAAHSLYKTSASGKQWAGLDGSCRFKGVELRGGGLVKLPYIRNQIEFLGDSITQGRRILYTGVGDDTGQQVPYANWPQLAADLLGMKPVVTGFGGQGLASHGTCGALPAIDAFPWICGGIRWSPAVKPGIVVIYQGTNDSVPAGVFEGLYKKYLGTIRAGYPEALIFAACPHNKTGYAAAIDKAVGAAGDRKIFFLDYSSGVIAPDKTCDGCHLNPGGAVALAARFASDIRARLDV
ncbi:MAG: GDSL-type esterase/lipase family protein [Kiritimatiellia bacterium]